MQESRPEEFHNTSETRNSRIRKLTSGTIQKITERVHQRFPGLHPDHLNILGSALVGTGSILAASREKGHKFDTRNKVLTGLSLTVTTLGVLTDAFDGSLARTLAREGKPVDFRTGQVKDAIGDRLQEWAMSISRAISANKRGDRTGEFVALLAAATNALPSLVRATSESQGKSVNETGKGWQGVIGTRIGRGTTSIIATAFPEIHGIPLQTISDTLTVGANLATTRDRIDSLRANAKTTLPEKTVSEAKLRRKALTFFALAAGAATVLTYQQLHRKS